MVGRTIAGRYEVQGLLGKGGFGAVFAGKHAITGQDVVLKVMRPEVASDPTQVKRFLNEARISSQLSHPNTVRVYDFGQTDEGLLYLVMERLRGEELSLVLKAEAPLQPLRTAHIAIGVLKSLSEAHAAGLVHRDLKPGNIFLIKVKGDDDFVKLIDFGIAKSIEPGVEEDLTRTGLAIGTPKYMSPEQGRAEALDGRSDLYSLGILMFELLSGRAPFEASSAMSMIVAHLQTPPPDIRRLAPDGLPDGLADIVMKALAKEPWNRFRDADDMREQLEDWVESAGGRGRRATSARLLSLGTVGGPHVPAAHGQSMVGDSLETVALPGGSGGGHLRSSEDGAHRPPVAAVRDGGNSARAAVTPERRRSQSPTADELAAMAQAFDREALSAQPTLQHASPRTVDAADASTFEPAPKGGGAGQAASVQPAAAAAVQTQAPRGPAGVRPNTPQRPAGPTTAPLSVRQRMSSVTVAALVLLTAIGGAAAWFLFLAEPDKREALEARFSEAKASSATRLQEATLPPEGERRDNRLVDSERRKKAADRKAEIEAAKAAGEAPPALPVAPLTTEDVDKVAQQTKSEMINCVKNFGDAGKAYSGVGATLTISGDGEVLEVEALSDLPEAMHDCVENRMRRLRFKGGRPDEKPIKAYVSFYRQVVGGRSKGARGAKPKAEDESLW